MGFFSDDPYGDEGPQGRPRDPVVPAVVPGGSAPPPTGGNAPPPEDDGSGWSPTSVVTGKNKGQGGGPPTYNPGSGPRFNIPGAPRFAPTGYTRPTLQDAYNEPGYQFRTQAGTDAIERSAAARGILRTGGTLKDISEYNQNFASQEYGNVVNRSLAAYDRGYQAEHDAFAPQMARYQAQVNAEQARATMQYQQQWEAYQFGQRNKGGGGGGGKAFIPAPPKPGDYY